MSDNENTVAPDLSPIPQEWIKAQVDALLAAAQRLGKGTLSEAIARRAENYMDLVESWKSWQKKQQP